MTSAATDAYNPRLKPLTALRALSRLMGDKESTREVFRLVSALDAPVTERIFQRFKASEFGAQVLRERRDLSAALVDRAALAQLPAGSLGRDYLDFVTREKISPEAFEDEMRASGESYRRAGEDRKRYIYRFRHSHDLLHVLTGFGRDVVGELALLAFTQKHNKSRALTPLIFAGVLNCSRAYPGLPIWSCVREGARMGRQAVDLTTVDWEALLELQTSDVRRQLNIGAPKRYLLIKSNAELIDRHYRKQSAA